MEKFFNWFADKLFDEKINDKICWTVIILSVLYIAVRVIFRASFDLLIA